MKKYFGKYASSGDVQTALDGLQLVNPYVALVENDTMDYDSKEPDYTKMYLTFEILTGGTFVWYANYANYTKTIEYSINDGPWVSITSNRNSTAVIEVESGDMVRFRGENNTYGDNGITKYTRLMSSDIRCNVMGNIMSLCSKTGFDLLTGSTANYAFAYLFMGLKILNAENLVLPCTSVGMGAYLYIFSSCELMVKGPKELPATSIGNNAYQNMFYNCRVLIKSPTIYVGTLSNYSLSYMFSDCRSLQYIKCLATDISATDCTKEWVYDVSATGTFVKAVGTTWTTGINGIPNGWTVIEE